MLKSVAALAENEVYSALLAENAVAALPLYADAEANAPAADAEFVVILSVCVLLVVEILADKAVCDAKLAENDVAADAEFAVYPATLALILVSNEEESV